MNVQQTEKECSNCGHPGPTWPTPHNQDLCVPCYETWFNSEEQRQTYWVLQCACEAIIKGKKPQEQCACGRVYVAFQLY